jgi:metallo-beta-lactamase family protein
LIRGSYILEAEPVPVEKKEIRRGGSEVYMRLQAAAQRLLLVVAHNEGGANKDLGKFADQINSLCDRWDR